MDELCNKWLRAVAEMDAGLMVGIAQHANRKIIVQLFAGWEIFHYFLLAHLNRRLMGELIVYQSLWHPSVVRPSTISNIFSSETTGPIKFKFHMETP